jgi:hypothetical protein
MRIRIFALAAFLLGVTAAHAQPVTVIGPAPVAGNIPIFNSPTVVKDSGYNPATLPSSTFVVGTTPISGGTANCIFYDVSNVLQCLATANNSILATDGSGVPGWATTLPSGFTSIDQNILNAQTSAYSAASTDCGKTITLGGSAEYALTVGAASGFPASCTVNIDNIDTGRGKVMTINGVTFPLGGILWPGMKFTLKNVGNVWTIFGLNNLWKITSAIQFNVDTVNGVDGNNDCLGATGTSGACATLANATTQFCKIAQVVAAQVTFQTVTEQTHPTQNLCVYQSAALLEENNNPIIQGDTTNTCSTAANFVINGISAESITTAWTITGIQLGPASSNTAVLADNHSRLYLSHVVFPTATVYHMEASYDAFIEMIGSYCITGGAAAHASSQSGSKILAKPTITVTISNTPAFSTAYAQSTLNAFQEWQSVTFSGSATGVRYSATLGGGIDTNGGGATFLPGNSGGTATSPGWYN